MWRGNEIARPPLGGDPRMGRAKAQPLRQKTATEWPLKGGKRSADAEAEGGKAAAFTGDWHLRIAAGQRGGRGVGLANLAGFFESLAQTFGGERKGTHT